MHDDDCVRCDEGCVVLTADEVMTLTGLIWLRSSVRADDRLASVLRLRKAWHDWSVHYLLIPRGLTPKERTIHFRRVRHESNGRRLYAERRRKARRLGGKIGYEAERAVQQQYPDGIPARLTVERVMLSCPPATAVFHRRIARLCALGERMPEPEVPPAFVVDVRSLVDQTIEELREEFVRRDKAP